jgi:phage terminase large subunit-like protein
VADLFWFDEVAADAAVRFFETRLHHTKGEWAGRTFDLSEWQKDDIIRPLFGWKRADGTRRYRKVYIEIPRKNGKSSLCAGLASLLLMADKEPGAEIYSAAADKDQARIVFEQAKQMLQASPDLASRVDIFKNSIVMKNGNSVYRVLSADAPTKHGLNAHGVIFDELHAQPNRDLWDVLTTSTASRRQPLVIAITTAGYDRESICWEQHEYARQVKAGIIQDDSFLPVMYYAEESDDWLDPAVWRKANPGMGVSVKEEYLHEQAKIALNSPAYQNTFRRLHLNQWVQQETRWLDMKAWDACAEPFDHKLLEKSLCYGGLDLSTTSDIASFLMCFPSEPGESEQYVWLPKFWIPEDNMIERARKDRVPYDAWVRDGLMTATPGNTIDYGYIMRDIEALGEKYHIAEIAFDKWGAYQMSQMLEGLGFTMVGFGQGFFSMSPPTKELMRLVLDGKLRHGGHPVLRWMADNMVVTTDPAGNVKPNKQKSREKIDGIVAGIMSLDRAVRHETKPMSVYEKRGLEVA